MGGAAHFQRVEVEDAAEVPQNPEDTADTSSRAEIEKPSLSSVHSSLNPCFKKLPNAL